MSVQCKFFHISIRNHQEAEEALDALLRSHVVVTVHREFVANRGNSFWIIVVEYLAGIAESRSQSFGRPVKKRVDYKEVLFPEDFSVLASLREWRKQAAEKAGVPVYTIFTNEQLAMIITRRVNSKTDLRGIEGIGEARVEKYGNAIVQLMQELAMPAAGSK